MPSPTQHAPPRRPLPPGQGEQGEPRGNGAGGKGTATGGARAGQTALAKNVATVGRPPQRRAGLLLPQWLQIPAPRVEETGAAVVGAGRTGKTDIVVPPVERLGNSRHGGGGRLRGSWGANYPCPPPPPPPRGLRPTVSWGGSWRPEPRGRPPPVIVAPLVPNSKPEGPCTAHGKDSRESIVAIVGSPCQDHEPADAHTGGHKSVLESVSQ